MTPTQRKLLEEVETLCALYLPKDAPGETWGETCERMTRMAKLAKKIRKEEAA